MKVSITDFNANISYYIDLSKKEDIELTKRGVVVAIIISRAKYERGVYPNTK